jgi:HlyD family secretion protein
VIRPTPAHSRQGNQGNWEQRRWIAISTVMLQPAPQRQGPGPAAGDAAGAGIATPTARRRPWLRRRRLWAGLLAGALLIGGGSAVLNQRRSATQQRNLATYTVLAREGSLPGVITASGELGAFRKVNVSPKRQGVLEELFVEEGDRVSTPGWTAAT